MLMGMRLIILGPPGSGKGTYSTHLAHNLGIAKISTGDIFRDLAKRRDNIGKQVTEIMERGELVPDEIVLRIFKERISQPDTRTGFILDGFPRTVVQAIDLDSIAKIDGVINIIAPEEILIEKISARRTCSNRTCDGNYNIADIRKSIDGIEYVLPALLPKRENVCDICGSPLYQRSDDKRQVILSRLQVYERQTKPLLDYYKGRAPFIDVHMNKPPEQVVEKIMDGIRRLV
jgi:adenylate kinase